MPDALRVLVWQKNAVRRIAVCDGAKLVEYYEESDSAATMVNSVLLGKVDRVLPAMKAAFVKVGRPQNGFLPIAEAQSFADDSKLVSGEDVIVQVKKDEKDQKGVFLSRDVALPGQFVIYMPRNRYVGVSKRVTDVGERERLSALGKALCGGAFGVVMREAALSARKDELAEELDELKELWLTLSQKAQHVKAPATLYSEPSVLAQLARDYAPKRELKITCNDAVNRMPSPVSGILWEQVGELEMEAHWRSLRLNEQLSEALGRRVALENGGWLMIDEREALSTIDVNSGRFVGAKDSDLALEQNLAACAEIVRQLRLRALSGIVLIDFIDMADDAQRERVVCAMHAALAEDRVKTVVHGFTSLGLLEMTRKRTGTSLRGALAKPCKACGGSGYQWERNNHT